jgi:hypothetical protein
MTTGYPLTTRISGAEQAAATADRPGPAQRFGPPVPAPERCGCRQAEEPGELVLKGNRPVSGAAGHVAYLAEEGGCEGGERGKLVAAEHDPVFGCLP